MSYGGWHVFRFLILCATGLAALLTLCPPTSTAGLIQIGPVEHVLTGQNKTLWVRSRTVSPDREQFTLIFDRLRIQWEARFAERGTLQIQYDHEYTLGSILKTGAFQAQKQIEEENFFDMESTLLDRAGIFARHRIHRALLKIYTPVADIRLGRQRIAWGSGRFWNPTDLFNPNSPIQLEKEERNGVDALRLDRYSGALSTLQLVYAPGSARSESSLAGRFQANTAGFDLSGMAGRFGEAWVIGWDFAGAVREMGVWGEAAYTKLPGSEATVRAVLGAEYTLESQLSWMAELYYNGTGKSRKQDYLLNSQAPGTPPGLARFYLGSGVGYPITPLFRWDLDSVINLNDGSFFTGSHFTYSVMTDLDWSIGAQFFFGADDTEYGALQNLLYTQLQWFF